MSVETNKKGKGKKRSRKSKAGSEDGVRVMETVNRVGDKKNKKKKKNTKNVKENQIEDQSILNIRTALGTSY